MSQQGKIAEKLKNGEIHRAMRFVSAWFTPTPPIKCEACKSTYEEGYICRRRGKMLCKGCVEAPLGN